MKTEQEIKDAIVRTEKDILKHCLDFKKADVEHLAGLRQQVKTLQWVLQ